MTAAEWLKTIREHCEIVGTNDDIYLPVMETLASILEQRDRAFIEYIEAGGAACIDTKGGVKSITKNPRLVVWNELNTQALAYWREMCLTPATLKRITEQDMKNRKKKNNTIEVLIASVEKENEQ